MNLTVFMPKTLVGNLTVYYSINGVIKINYEDSIIVTHMTELGEKIQIAFDNYFKYKNWSYLLDIPINLQGTIFQNKVWKQIRKIPIGEVRTYSQIAKEINTSAIAVGNACSKNILPLIIPCHRVVSTKRLGNYSFGNGLETKKLLLQHEGYL